MRLNELTGLGDKVRETFPKEEGKRSGIHEMPPGMYERAVWTYEWNHAAALF